MEIRGIRPRKPASRCKNFDFFTMREPEYFFVPLATRTGDISKRAVNVGDKVNEGSILAKPNGKYGSFVYSPVSGKVVTVVKKLNASAVMCEHVVIASDHKGDKEYLPVIEKVEFEKEILLKRLYESGMVDNFEPYDPAYKKYLSKNSIKKLIINCAKSDPYAMSSMAIFKNYFNEALTGARLLLKIAEAKELLFIFTRNQRKEAKLLLSEVRKKGLNKVIKVKLYPNIYPLHYARLISYYETGKMVPNEQRTAENHVIVDSIDNCFDFYRAVTEGRPAIERAVTVAGNNCLRKTNYMIKNGTKLSHILEVIGTTTSEAENMLIYGGILTGIAEESKDVSVSLDASTVLFMDASEFIAENETPCINCGKCVDVCPVKLNVKKLDQAFLDRRFGEAARLGVECCIGCGACSYVCPAKRNLSQRLKYMKDYVLGKTAKDPASAEYVLVEGDEVKETSEFDKILDHEKGFEDVKPTTETPEIEKMLEVLEKQSKKEGETNE